MRAVNLLPPDRAIAKSPSRLDPILRNPIPVAGGAIGVATVAGLAMMVW